MPNKITREMRNILAPVIENYITGVGIGKEKYSLEQDLAKMEPEDRAKIISGLVPYVMPKLASVEVKNTEPKKTFQDELNELSEVKELT